MAETLDIGLLRTFVAIEECGGFGRAAAALRVSQPTVSQHVRVLEGRLGQRLVERDGRVTKLTPAGEKLLAEARRIVAVHDDALARLDVTSRRTIIIGLTEMIAEQALPALATTIGAAHPDHSVQFMIDRSTQMADAVAKGEIDFALVLDTDHAAPGIEVGSLPLQWYASASWTPPPADVAVRVVACVDPCVIRRRALRRLRDRGYRIEIAAESSSVEGVVAAARAGIGVAALPGSEHAPAGLVVRRDLPELGPIFVRLITRRGGEVDIESTAVRAMEGFFRNGTTRDDTSRRL